MVSNYDWNSKCRLRRRKRRRRQRVNRELILSRHQKQVESGNVDQKQRENQICGSANSEAVKYFCGKNERNDEIANLS